MTVAPCQTNGCPDGSSRGQTTAKYTRLRRPALRRNAWHGRGKPGRGRPRRLWAPRGRGLRRPRRVHRQVDHERAALRLRSNAEVDGPAVQREQVERRRGTGRRQPGETLRARIAEAPSALRVPAFRGRGGRAGHRFRARVAAHLTVVAAAAFCRARAPMRCNASSRLSFAFMPGSPSPKAKSQTTPSTLVEGVAMAKPAVPPAPQRGDQSLYVAVQRQQTH